MASAPYKLDLDPPKRNVFVTQLNERDDEDHDMAAYPIVKESAAQLIETGLNTMQKTLLLKKEIEVDKVSEELARKRAEFRERMEKCAEQQVEIQKKQQRMRDRVNKFEKFIKENEAKRRRAIQKYQTEVKTREQKHTEHEMVQQQLASLETRHEYLKNKLARYKIYEDYLLQVLEIMPAHYLEVNDSMITSLMMRHRTLHETNTGLVSNLTSMSDNLEKHKIELDDLEVNQTKMKLSINSQLSVKVKMQDVVQDKNQEMEQRNVMGNVDLRHQRSELGQIVMAIDNLAEKCRRRLDPAINGLALEAKLNIVKEYLVDTSDIIIMADQMSSERRSASQRRPSRAIFA
ncbi:hypothetical protein CAPTEDRAFT_220283 [Capitella teleta]|uniref:DUF4200 domain-containing protein n=1 Tax=Capitella teleta TaxID=283909 RepID=R7UL62_CAPTE|nr:hypothetical protein CAPTEDRAFT_220283 [Capitella teleta]|eukprot:ELU04528.1 hypothetical protein CAPTEDRAFT_220283 [Capitella teleta]